ncbi:hypothetical protein Tcan_00713, partial [Toxocara canis]
HVDFQIAYKSRTILSAARPVLFHIHEEWRRLYVVPVLSECKLFQHLLCLRKRLQQCPLVAVSMARPELSAELVTPQEVIRPGHKLQFAIDSPRNSVLSKEIIILHFF